MVVGRICLPGDDLGQSSTVTATPESADPKYQAANLLNPDRAYVVRSTGTSMALRYVFGATRTPIRLSLHNTNATSAIATNPAGLNVAIPIPSVDADGQRVDAHLDISEEPLAAAGEITVTISRASGIVEIGNIGIWVAEYEVNWEAGRDEGILRPGNTMLETELGSEVWDDQGIRRRWYEMTFTLQVDLALYRGLDLSSKGPIRAFPLVADVTVNDALWVRCPEPFTARRRDPFVDITRRFVEVSGGPPNG